MRLLSLAALLAPALIGQDFRGSIKLKPLLPPIAQPWKFQAPPKPEVIERAVPSRPCAVPLLNTKRVETDGKMVVPPPANGFHMRQVTPPAPSCADQPRP
jgi:hypothetical protein